VSAAAKQAVEVAKAKLIDGSAAIFKGDIKDNTGKVVIPSGETYSLQNPRLNSVDWLVEGVVGNPKG
jgi:basic membrane protein A and related proteins